MKTKHHHPLPLRLLIFVILRCRFISRIILSGCFAALGSSFSLLHSQVPNLVSYQGRVAVGTVNFEGTGQFRFALVNTAGTTVYWGNAADTAPADGVPDTAVNLTVTKGLYSVLLGDTSIANMATIPASVWANPEVRLRVWFDDSVNGNQLLTPDQRLSPTGYLADGVVSTAKIASGAVDSPQLAGSAITSAKLASNAVTSAKLANNLTLGGTTTGTFSGSGAALTNLNGESLTAGSVTAAKLGADVGLWSVNGANVFRSVGNVGIGVTNPTRTLEVDGTSPSVVIGNEYGAGRTSLLLAVTANMGGHSILQSISSAGSAHGPLSLQPSGGEVGIGTETPTAKLEVNGDVKGTAFIGSGAALTNLNGASLDAGSVSDTKLATLSTAGKVANSATTGTAEHTPDTLVLRDGSGDFSTRSLTLSGSLNLPATTAGGDGVLSIGGARVLHALGAGNFFAGQDAGNLTMTGDGNTASGVSALYSNTEGSRNTANGWNALYANIIGSNNTAIGAESLYYNTGGHSNTAIGVSALYSNTTGGGNTANGREALYWNTIGSRNTANGWNALYSNTNGSRNTANGWNALFFNTTGIENTASGTEALYSNTIGYNNTASGERALTYNTSGFNNTASGSKALFFNTSGFYNTAIGFEALISNTTGTNNIALGSKAGTFIQGSNNICIGNVGTTTDSGIIRIGNSVQHTQTVLSGDIHAKGNFYLHAVEGEGQSGTAYLQGRNVMANTNVGLTLRTSQSNGTVHDMISMTATGQMTRNGNGASFDVTSDRRLKTGIVPIASALGTLGRVNPIRYHYKAEFLAKHPSTVDKEHYGVVAQEFREVFPGFVSTGEDGYLSVKADPLIFVATAAIKELHAKHNAAIQAKDAEIAALKKQLSSIDARLAALEQSAAAKPVKVALKK